VCGILTLFFLFYFNRLFATLVSYGLRAYTWHKYRVYVDVQALQISLLGGRVFFKGVRYHGENETFLIQNGYITWKYWLQAVKQADCARFASSRLCHSAGSNGEFGGASPLSDTGPNAREAGAIKAAQDLPSRISVSVSGFEWFIYNRSPAYEAIAAAQAQALKPEKEVTQPSAADVLEETKNTGTKQKESPEGSWNGTQQLKQLLTRLSTKSMSGDFSTLAPSENRRQSVQGPHGHGPETSEIRPSSESEAPTSSAPGPSQDAPSNTSPLLLTLFPILIECQKGAIVIGNENTRNILTTSFERSRGHIDAAKSGSRDIYRQIFEFEVTHPVVQLKPNLDYRQPQQAAAQNIIRNAASAPNKKRWWKFDWRFHHRKRKVLHSLRTSVPYFRSSVESFRPSSVDPRDNTGAGNWPNEVPGESRWLGLSRYLDDEERDDHEGWSNVEYARFSNVVDCPSAHLTLFWDVPGKVEQDLSLTERVNGDYDINLAKPPAYGLDLVVRGGNINYGPWADRARAEIQSVFFPNSYQDAVPATQLSVGSLRQSTVLSINVHIENETTLVLPTKENSKDWQWKGRAGALRGVSGIKHRRGKRSTKRRKDDKDRLGPDARPPGWFAISVLPNSTVSYNMDMVARMRGYHNELELDLKGTKMTTSVNHALLWSCGPQKVSCNLSNPLGWNALHEWIFDIRCHGMELFLLRDHIFLLVDLISDFTSGPSSDYLAFVPFIYRLRLSFTDIKLHLNANDSNIIDSPCDVDENTFLILHGETLDISVDIPLESYAPSDSNVTFQASARDAQLNLATPSWNTAHTFASAMPTATLKDFSMDGYYNYCSSTSPTLTDSLFLYLRGFSPRIFLHGSLIKYCIKLKDNYFGDDVHFRTREEYRGILQKKKNVDTGPVASYNKKDNDLDVILNVTFDRVCALLPANLYSRKENLRLDFLVVEADVRFTNYYMDLEAKFSPVEAAWESIKAEEVGVEDHVSKPQAFVDGISIYGHRLFGSAPSEPTYVCNWDFDVGRVSGECSSVFVRILLQAVRCFSFTLDDDENALPQSHMPMIHDITFLSARIGNINLWFPLEEIAIQFGAGGLEVTFNDWAGKLFSERLRLEIPDIQLAAIDQNSAIRLEDQMYPTMPTHALLQLSILLRMVERKRDLAQERQLQQQHVQFHDQRTRRTDWLLDDSSRIVQPHEPLNRTMPNPAAMPIPPMPAPLFNERNIRFPQRTESRGRRVTSKSRLRHKTSFFSRDSPHITPSLRSVENISDSSDRRVNQPSFNQPSDSALRATPRYAVQPTLMPATASSRQNTQRAPNFPPTLKSDIPYCSPWTAPYFQLQRVSPDARNLPDKPHGEHLATETRKWERDASATFEHIDSDNQVVYTMFDVDLGSTLRGFAFPTFFAAIATLIKDLQPARPTDLLDDLQIGTMSQIRKILDARTKRGQITDFCARLPYAHLRILDSGSSVQKPSNGANLDQYDLQLGECKLTARSSTTAEGVDKDAKAQNSMRLHVSLQRCLLEIHDRSPNAFCDNAATSVLLEDIVLWMSSDKRLRVRFQQRDLKVTSWASQIRYMVPLIQRTADMSDFIISHFATTDSVPRIQCLVYHLADVAGTSTDPVFLTRPSYVLRTADDHVRLNDSWKIASRLRYMLQSLDTHQQRTLLQKLNSSDTSLPSNAEALVIAGFNKWCSWDLADVSKSLIMETVWRISSPDGDSKSRRGDLLLELAIEKVRFILDPGPKENQIGVYDINTAVSIMSSAGRNTKDVHGDVIRPRIVMVQAYFSRFGINLNWELVELIGDTLELYMSKHETIRQPSLDSTKATHALLPWQQLHVVVGMESGVVTLDSINITIAMAASGMKASMLHQVETDRSETRNMLLTSQSASAKIKDNEKVVLACILENAILSLSKTSSLSRRGDRAIIQAASKCDKLRFELRDNLGHSLEIAHRIVRDEVDIVKGLATQLGARSQSVQKMEHSDAEPQQDIHIALFLNQYCLSVALLPLLDYVMSGNGARTSIVPRKSSAMAINFDLEDHSHAFKLKDRNMGSQVSMLKVPPINSRVVVTQNITSTKVNIDTTLNKVELDGRSVRSCIDTVNTPEVVKAFVNAKKSAERLKSQLNALFPSQTDMSAKASKPTKALLYDANVTLIGLGVHVSAPALKSKDYRAELNFVLGLTTARLWNKDLERSVAHEQPQFEVSFRGISLYINRRSKGGITKYGSVDLGGRVMGSTKTDDKGNQIQVYHAASDSADVNLGAETASLVVDIAAHLQERIKSFTLSEEVKRLKPLRRLTSAAHTEPPTITITADYDKEEETSSNLFDSVYSFELNAIKIAWRLDASNTNFLSRELEDLVFSIQKVKLNTRREGSATLAITDLQLQMAPKSLGMQARSLNSALMPDVVFKVAYLSTKKDRRFAFQAAGKALDLRLASDFMIPATALRASLTAASAKLREGSAFWAAQPPSSKKETTSLFGRKYLASLLVDADFAGAVVTMQARKSDEERKSVFGILKGDKWSRAGRYDQVIEGDGTSQATLRAPGVAMKMEYSYNGRDDPALNAEFKVAASSNVLYPSVVPLIIEVSSSIKEIVGTPSQDDRKPVTRRKSQVQKPLLNSSLASSDAANLMGRCKVNLALWIREQEFSLSCQPIARVAATAKFRDIFMAVNTVQSPDQGRFFALSANFSDLQASVQHVYSRESTASFEVDSIVLSMMNSKHVTNTTGVSAILNVSPMKASVNAKQLQDFLLFREIWYPAELRQASSNPTAEPAAAESQAIVVQRYQQVAAAGAFPWNAVVSVQELTVQLDLGQSLGKSTFTISKLWAFSKKASDFEQNLCLGFERVGVESTGRMSGFVELQNFRVRTSIQWPQMDITVEQTPLVQASLGLDQLRVKAAFDYQPFAIAEISKFDFLMYNVQPRQSGEKDRLVGNLEGEKVQVFCTTATASQALALYQAVVRLIQEKEIAYEASLKELDKYLRRKSVFPSSTWTVASTAPEDEKSEHIQGPFSLHTDVLVTLRAVNIGAFPSTFFDNQIFKIEARDAQARFAVSATEGKTHSRLGLTLGQLRVALSTVNRSNTQALGEVSVSEVVNRATSSRDGTILKVPRVVASMQTWQLASSNSIEYIFQSTFEGKVDVGWNYSRISFIRGMWATHSRALASRLGKPLPQSAVQITGGPQPDGDPDPDPGDGTAPPPEKITAVVHVPQSRFEYRALEPPVIETPQLRDMGDATPPLEWIGLHRDKLPNVTHQIVIVTLLEVAKEVEDAYAKILGSSQ
jgi:hypothetical protein